MDRIGPQAVQDAELNELLQSEIPKKRSDLGPDAPLKRVLQSLMADAGKGFRSLQWFALKRPFAARRYSDRLFAPEGFEDPDRSFFDQIVASVERSSADNLITKVRDLIAEDSELAREATFFQRKAPSLPTADQARRLRVMTGSIPGLLPVYLFRRGIGNDRYKVWQLIWIHACGTLDAPEIAKRLRPKFDPLLEQLTARQFDGKRLSDAELKQAKADHYKANPVVNRNQIFRIRDRAYDALVKRIEPLLD